VAAMAARAAIVHGLFLTLSLSATFAAADMEGGPRCSSTGRGETRLPRHESCMCCCSTKTVLLILWHVLLAARCSLLPLYWTN
jgi:hypothetical protein